MEHAKAMKDAKAMREAEAMRDAEDERLAKKLKRRHEGTFTATAAFTKGT